MPPASPAPGASCWTACSAGRRCRSRWRAPCCWRRACRCSTCTRRCRASPTCRMSLAIVSTYQHVQKAFPGSQTPAVMVVKADRTSTTPQYRRAYMEFQRRARATGLLFPPFHVSVSPDRTVARVDFSIAGKGDDPSSIRRARCTPPRRDPAGGEDAARRGRGGDRRDRGNQGLQRPDEVAHAIRVRIRARARVPAAADDVPLHRDPGLVDRAQSAIGRRRVRDPRARSSSTAGPAAFWGSDRTARSRPGCRCSCSSSCSGSRWTTTSSSSAASRSCATAA